MTNAADTNLFSLNQAEIPNTGLEILRDALFHKSTKSIRLASLCNNAQSQDISNDILMNGYCRLHTFLETQKDSWLPDPLPTIPAARALKCLPEDVRNARVLQLSGCNIRCWYCFVDYQNLSPHNESSSFFSVDAILDALTSHAEQPMVLDLSGGNPALVPEWFLWSIQEIKKRKFSHVYIWGDDNLTTDFFFTKLTKDDRKELVDFPFFGSVGCFKGFDEDSFRFNLGNPSMPFKRQFDIFQQLFSIGWDIYGYVTFTTPIASDIKRKVSCFVDMLQNIDHNLPMRVIPLEIKLYTPTTSRVGELHKKSLSIQYDVLHCWQEELHSRFPDELLKQDINDIKFISR